MAVNCPYCGEILEKMPARKKRCPHCSETIYVKSTPDDRTKRLVTEAQANAAEQAWDKYHRQASIRKMVENTLPVLGLSAEYLDQLLAQTGWTASVAMEAILMAAVAPSSRMTRQQRKFAHFVLARMMVEAGDARWRGHMEQSIREELAAMEYGGALAVRIVKPRPWKPATKMVEMRANGASVDEIAKATGYSPITVNRNLESGGADPRLGPQCDRHAGRIFSFSAALAEMALPCGENCVCDWSPLFPSDFPARSQGN